MATAATVFAWLPGRARAYLTARWSRQLLEVVGVRLYTSGKPLPVGLLVANHVSWLDIFAINALAPTTFVAKDDVLHWPAIGWLSAKVGTLFMERGSRTAAARTNEHLIAALRRGHRVCVFPEGTTGPGDRILPFKGALFQSAIDAGVRIAPVLIRYLDAHGRQTTAAAYVGETSLTQCLWNITRASGLGVRADFLPAIDAGSGDRRHLAHYSHQAIARALGHQLPAPGEAAAYSQPCGSTCRLQGS